MKQKILISLSAIASIFIIGVAVVSSQGDGKNNSQSAEIKDGVQIVRILARGGYNPRQVSVKAGTPTMLEVQTKGSYDCSTSLVIPALNYETQLPSTGITKIDIPPQKAGTKITGLCSMGMYSFNINFN